MEGDDSSSSSRQKDRLNDTKSRLSSSSSIQTIPNVSSQQIQANDQHYSEAAVDSVALEEASELGPMNYNNTQEEDQQAPHPQQHQEEEPEMEIVGDTESSASNNNNNKNPSLHASFQHDHEQDEASLAQLELNRRRSEEEEEVSTTRTPILTNLPASPVSTIQKSNIEAHTPETTTTAGSSTTSSSTESSSSSSLEDDDDDDDDDVPMDEEPMIQNELQETATIDVDSSSVSENLLNPPKTNRKSSVKDDHNIYAGKEDDATNETASTPNEQGWGVLQLVRDKLSSIMVVETNDNVNGEKQDYDDDDDTKTRRLHTVQESSSTAEIPPESNKNSSPTNSLMEEEEEEEDEDDFSEYVSLSDRIPRRKKKKKKKRKKDSRRKRKNPTATNSSSSSASSPFFASIESMFGGLMQVPETIGEEACVPMCACTTEGMEDASEIHSMDNGLQDLTLHA